MLTLNFTLTKEDFCNFYLHVMWDDPAKQKKRRLHYIKQIVTSITFTTVFYFTGLFSRGNSFAYIIVGFLLLSTILSITGLRSGLINEAKNISGDADNRSLFLNTKLFINERSIILTDELTERIFKWQSIIKMQENNEYFFLFYTASEAIIIPKRILKNVQTKNALDELLAKFLSLDAVIGAQID